MNEELLTYWVMLSSVLAIKMWSNSAIQVFGRFRNKQFVLPEDAKIFGKFLGGNLAPANSEHMSVNRAARCWQNDLENIPLFLILALGFVLIGGSTSWGMIYFGVFAIARVLHTLFYLLAIQPWRTIVYEVGAGVTVIMLGHMLYLIVV